MGAPMPIIICCYYIIHGWLNCCCCWAWAAAAISYGALEFSTCESHRALIFTCDDWRWANAPAACCYYPNYMPANYYSII